MAILQSAGGMDMKDLIELVGKMNTTGKKVEEADMARNIVAVAGGYL